MNPTTGESPSPSRSNEELLEAYRELEQSYHDIQTMQAQLIESEKLHSVGRLAAGVAHELKNPLAVLRMGIEVLQHSNASEEAKKSLLDDMLTAADRADFVVRELLDYSAPRKLSLAQHNIQDVLDRTFTLASAQAGASGVRIVDARTPGLPPLHLDANRVQHALLNLLVNAIQATQSGGEVVVRTSSKTLTGLGGNVGDSLMDRFRVGDTLVMVEIEDRGQGIASDKMSRIFEPFFTTKPTGKGTGLGLTVCKTIIEMHGGALALRNRVEGGVVATVVFRV